MKLGFVSTILGDLSLEQVLDFASAQGYTCVELMCWPPGKAERRYAGVTHLDVTSFGPDDAARTLDLCASKGVSISALGYYPNVLAADRERAAVEAAHIRKVIDASALLGVGVMTTFVGRDHKLSVDENWPRFLEVWRPLVAHADERGVKIGIENCPMLFTADEWPGGKNLLTTPAIWERAFSDIPSGNFGLNYDPSHFILQMMDEVAPIYAFKDRLHHIHAKDLRIDRKRLDQQGVFAYPNSWHSPKLPGLGQVRWADFFAALAEVGYDGPVAVEVEDRAYEGSLEKRKESLVLSARYLRTYVAS